MARLGNVTAWSTSIPFMGWGSRRTAPAGERQGWAGRAVPVLTAVLLMLSFVSFPSAPPDNDVDSSLSGVLSYAHQQGLQFGTDVVFTYGPLGYLMFYYYAPHAAGLRMVVDVALALVASAGLCLVAWRLRPLWRWLLLALFFWIAPNISTPADLVFNVALLCWGLLCFFESGRRLSVCVLVFTGFAAFAALAKVSFLFSAAAGVALIEGDLALRNRWRLAVGMGGGFGLAFILGWMGSGQALTNLGAYLVNGLAVVEAYNGAQGWEGPVLLRAIELVLALVVLVMIILRAATAFGSDEPRRAARRLVLLAWLGLLSFVVWKHGSVRANHEVFLLGFIPVLALALEGLPGEGRAARNGARALALGACTLSLATMQVYCLVGWPASLRVPFRMFGRNLACLLNPPAYQREMEVRIEMNRREAQLPRSAALIGRASIDVFGDYQAYALHNGWNYRPRPVFQSYFACSQPLIQMNERYYRSPAAPEYVLFRLLGLDHKYPPLADAEVLRTLLANYQPLATEDRFILLKRATTAPLVVSLAREGMVRQNQVIDLREFSDTDLWLEIILEPTWLGRLRQMLCRPPMVRLAAWHEPGGKLMVRKRAPAQMLAAGFLASPLLLNNEDVLNLYADRATARPGACSVELVPGEGHYWQDTVRYRIYKVQSRLGRSVSADLAAELFKHLPSHEMSQQDSSNTEPFVSAEPAASAKRPFRLFPVRRWRSDAPPPGRWEENATFALFLATPLVSLGLLLLFVRRARRNKAPPGWGRLVAGNALVLLCLVTAILLAGETYFRFFYDTTDSLAFTRISERWVQRHWRVNTAGCRDNVEYSRALTPGKRRISFVGDSFTAGHGIKDVADRFPNRLRRAHPEWEIHVLATVGLDTGSELAVMKKALARDYQIDQVVLVYCLNDIGDLLPPQANSSERVRQELDHGNWFVRNSYMVNLWYHHYWAAREPNLRDYFPFVREAYRGTTWQQQQERLKAFRDLIQAQGGHLAVVTFPFLHALGPSYEYRAVHKQLDQLWLELGVPHLDLLPVFGGLPSSQVTVNRYDAHPNERANRLAAEAIDQWLQRLNTSRARGSGL